MSTDWPKSDKELIALAASRQKPSTSRPRMQRGPAMSVRGDATRAPHPKPFDGITLVVPLKHCVSDNAKYFATVQRGKARLFLSPDYRQAKETIGAIARRAMAKSGQRPADGPVALSAVVYFENNRRDLQNVSKQLCDAMSGIVYADDKQITEAHWHRGENDKDHPRVELTVRGK